MTKRDLQNFDCDLKAFMLKRDRIMRRWMLIIILVYSAYFAALVTELWFLTSHK
jgi:hypothetical protein